MYLQILYEKFNIRAEIGTAGCYTQNINGGFEVLMAMTMKSCSFWDIMSCRPLKAI
jgi:hypothetical protein